MLIRKYKRFQQRASAPFIGLVRPLMPFLIAIPFRKIGNATYAEVRRSDLVYSHAEKHHHADVCCFDLANITEPRLPLRETNIKQ